MARSSGCHHTQRALWSSVVLQALEDIENQPVQSMAFTDAEAFFTRSGAWAESRTAIGDFLDLHRDELEAIGRRFLEARRSREAVPATARQPKAFLCESLLRLARPAARQRSRAVSVAAL